MADSTMQPGIQIPQGQQSLAVSDGAYILNSVATVAAAGSAQGDATAITSEIAYVTASDGTKGVKLPSPQVGMKIVVINTVNAVLKVYGTTGCAINAIAANSAISQAALSAATYVCVTSTQWYTVPTVPS